MMSIHTSRQPQTAAPLSCNSPQTIVLVVSTPGQGGTERISVMVGNALVRSGHRVHMIFIKACGTYTDIIDPLVTIHDLNSKPIELHPIHNIRKIRQLGSLFKNIRPNVIFSNGYYCNCLSILAGRLATPEIRLVIRETNLTVTKCKKKGLNGLFVLSAIKALYPKASSFIAPTVSVAEDFGKIIDPSKIPTTIIPNFIDTEELEQRGLDDVDDERFADLKGPILLSVGRLVDQKDYSTALKAMQMIMEKTDCHYVILGEGPLETDLKKQAKDLGISNRVHFLGFKANPYPYFKKADLFLMTSWVEGFGIVVLEAMFFGLPGVFTNFYPSFGTIVENGVNGIIVPVGDHKRIAENVSALLGSPDLYTRLKTNAKSRARDFMLPVIMPQFEETIYADNA